MIKLCASIFLLLSLVSASCQQSKGHLYNEKEYTEHHKGKIEGYYTIVYYYNKDTSYTMRKFYPDSLYQDTSWIVMKHYFHNNVMEGPTEAYDKGKLFSKGFMKADKRHGEFLYYEDDSKLDRREFYDMGRRVGVWEDYYPTGNLFKKVYYDNGKFVKQEIYDRKIAGKLVRTEYEESWQY